MNVKRLIWTIVAWVILTLVNYYFMPYFILVLIWLALSSMLLVVTIIQLVRLIRERKDLKKLRIAKFIIFISLFVLTFYSSITNLVIEKIDWIIFENMRTKIVRQVKDKKLNPNVSWNNWICELPFEFPVISNGGNDIGIYRNKENGKTTITFWVFRNYFESPSTHFIYTDDPEEIERIEEKIAIRPIDNWKIKNNWYRTHGD